MQDEQSTTSLEIVESLEILIDAIALNPIAIGKLVALLSDKTFTAVQKIPYMQLKRYIDGVRKAEENLADGCKLADKLFSDPKKRNENGMRVYKMVTSSDTERKIDYLVDATRSMLLGFIDPEMMFRAFRAIVETLPEDLDYLSGLIEKGGPYKGNIRVHALVRAGLMISAGIDAEADIEEQDYEISTLGYVVDQFVLSINDENRWNWYKTKSPKGIRMFNGPQPASDEEVAALMEQLFDDHKPELIEAARPIWQGFTGTEDALDKIGKISQKKEAVALLVYATKVEGTLFVMQDISHSNPYVEIGKFILPDNDDARRSAEWVGAVNTLEETRMLECVNRKDGIYRLTDEGWKQAEIYIEENEISEDDMKSLQGLLEALK